MLNQNQNQAVLKIQKLENVLAQKKQNLVEKG